MYLHEMQRHLTSKVLSRNVETKVENKVDKKVVDQKMIWGQHNDRPGVALVALAITVGLAGSKKSILNIFIKLQIYNN
jgi:hypothetical protein